jgi:class 3 adenylate cyclase
MKIELDDLTLNEIVQLQIRLSEMLKRRFEKPLALAFSDVVGSTGYAARFGNEAGRALNQRHLDLIEQAIGRTGGRVVDIAGDGAFTCYASAENAVRAMIALQRGSHDQNLSHEPEHALTVRAGVHWGPVLTDNRVVTGREVNLCARVAASAGPAEIRMTLPAFHELPSAMRVDCASLPAEYFKGFTDSFSLVRVAWQEPAQPRPTAVLLRETGEQFPLPDKDTVSFGRLRDRSGDTANDIVLALPDKEETQRISRWHFELRRRGPRWFLHSLTGNALVVDGQALAKGAAVPIQIGSEARVAEVLTLEFVGAPRANGALASESEDTVLVPSARRPR